MKANYFKHGFIAALLCGMAACAEELVLPKVEPPAASPASLKDAAPNTWVKVAGAPGPRSSFGLTYLPTEKCFVCFGGAMAMNPETDKNATHNPYSELTLNLEKGVWENRFPKGKEGLWGEAVGPSRAPKFPGSYYAFTLKDVEANARPYLGGGYYNAAWLWGNAAFDRDRGRVVLYWTLAHQAGEYDPIARTWELSASAAGMPQEFRDGMLFGALCYEPVNKEVIGGQFEYAYKDGKWRKQELGSALVNGLRDKGQALRIRARNLAGAARARYYLAETSEEAKVKLDETAAALVKDATALAEEIRTASGKAEGYAKLQTGWAAEALAAVLAGLKRVQGLLAANVTAETIAAADAVREDCGSVAGSLAACPPKRAHARMVYDEKNQKIVLFGGDTLDRLLADTWVYDPAARRWEQRRPKRSPPPGRCKLVYLPRCGKVLLVGAGLWTYDVKEDRWQRLAEASPVPSDDWLFPNPAAVNGDDVVVGLFKDAKSGLAAYAARLDTARTDPEGTAKGVAPGTASFNSEATENPQWFEKNAPPPDPAAEEEWFKKLPANTWTLRESPNWPKIEYRRSRCWGTCAIDTGRGQLLHFGGGHGTYDGNDVLHYSIRANRFFIGHRPEHTLNFAPNGIGIPACKSYQGRPYMSCHTYHAYTYDSALRKMVFFGTKTEDKVFTYDPLAGDWDLTLGAPFSQNGFNVNRWMFKCAPTPKGAVVWTAEEGLWRVNAAGMTCEKLPFQVGGVSWDSPGLVYDSKRDRLLLFSDEYKGGLLACALQGGGAKLLAPAGKGNALREIAYLPECDAVLMAARPAPSPDDKLRWLLYDCEKNAWLAVHLPGNDLLGKETFNNSLGLMSDPVRKLVWAMDILSRPHVLRLDLKSADVLPLDAALPAPAGK